MTVSHPSISASARQQAAMHIVERLRAAGHIAYFAGGCVRDLLLGRDPSDFDVATSATPQQVLAMFPRTFAVGAQFGVVLVVDACEGAEILTEVATFRSDGAYSDGRRPDAVRYTDSAEQDVLRRDFTINGMLLDPARLRTSGSVSNAVLDFVGGREDLQRGIVRAIGDPGQRFAEDKLRMLRAVRFAARFGFEIEANTLRAIRAAAREIDQVSCERVREELTRMLTEGAARRAFEMLEATGLLAEVLPEVARMAGVEQPPQYHPEGDVWIHTRMLLQQLPPGCSATLAWGALLHDVGKPATFRIAPDRIRFDGHVEVGVRMAEDICRRLRMSNGDTEQILALVANHMRFADVEKMRESTLKRFFRLHQFEEHLALHRMDCMASHRDLSLYRFALERYQTAAPEQIRPAPLMTGDDLIALGFRPGPEFRNMLTLVEDAQLEGRIDTREQALAMIAERFPRPPNRA
ncbi:MAG: CCA tRNA nucleotidyltransferase [Acidobacteriaceae bacterium]